MQKMVLLVGNIGSGKSTLSKKYAEDSYIVICRDALREMIGAGEYVFTSETEECIKRHARLLAYDYLVNKFNVVIDETHMTIVSRKEYIAIAKELGVEVHCVVFKPIDKETAVSRRMLNSRNVKRADWEKVWDTFSIVYQEPTEEEGIKQITYV